MIIVAVPSDGKGKNGLIKNQTENGYRQLYSVAVLPR